jgi:ATP-dependent Lon protease
MNPCILFDELDKVGEGEKGREIIGILTHMTDSTQNDQFHDKYFPDVDLDISRTVLLFSYNDESMVNPILKDRMYSIQTKGYNTKEKITIANDYLLPKIREQVNFKKDDIIIPDETLEYIITNAGLTKSEDGVRNLKRCLEVIYTKLNLFRLVSSTSDNLFTKDIKLKVEFPFTVTKKDVDALIKNEEKLSQSVLNSMYV